jgi:hypothetical protein
MWKESFLWLDCPIWAWASSFRRGFMITHIRHTSVGRTPLDEEPARRRDLYLIKHNTHKRQTSKPPVGFEPTILVSERPKTHALWKERYLVKKPVPILLHPLQIPHWLTRIPRWQKGNQPPESWRVRMRQSTEFLTNLCVRRKMNLVEHIIETWHTK